MSAALYTLVRYLVAGGSAALVQLDIIDSQDGTAPAMDAVEAMLRGRPKD